MHALSKKKSYPIEFSFKFNYVNKILQSVYELVYLGKNVPYFYNKFKPVNRSHYIKFSVNSLLLI
jgi:hypothetical protein